MAYYFGASMATDAFVTAFRIPNLLRDMFAEGALSSAFVPVFKEKLIDSDRSEAFHLARIVFTMLLLLVGLLVLLGIVAAPVIVYVTAHGFTATPEKFHLTVSLTRIMMAYLLLVSLSALVMGMLNSLGRFGIPALAPAMFNIGTVVTVVCLYDFFSPPVYTLALGVLVGGLGQLCLQLPSLWRLGFRFGLCFDFLDDSFKRDVRLILPMVVGLSGSRLNILASTLIASFLIEGSISYLSYSYRLMHFPLGVFAVAIGTVALPRVSEMVARKELDGLADVLNETLALNLFVIVPSAAFLAIMGRDLVELVFQWGAFSSVDSENTARTLFHYSYGLIGFAAIRVVAPFYYAFQDSRLPMKLSLITVGVNLLLYYPLVSVLDFAGLAAATSAAGLLNFFLLLKFLPSKGIKVSISRVLVDLAKLLVVAVISFTAAQLLPLSLRFSELAVVNRAVSLIVPAILGTGFYMLLCLILRISGPILLFRWLRGLKSRRG